MTGKNELYSTTEQKWVPMTSNAFAGGGAGAGTYSATPPTLADGAAAGNTYDERSRLRTTSGPATEAAAVTPSDSTVFAGGISRGIYVGVTGNVTALINGVAVLFTAVPAGTILPIRATRVNATGSTASAMVVLY